MVLDPINTCCEFFERPQKYSCKRVCQENNIKHRILIRRRFYRVLKPLHVMFYGPYDRSMFGFGSKYLSVYFKIRASLQACAANELHKSNPKCSKQFITLGIFLLKK